MVIWMTYCKYVQQFQICKDPFMGSNLDWNKIKMVINICCFHIIFLLIHFNNINKKIYIYISLIIKYKNFQFYHEKTDR